MVTPTGAPLADGVVRMWWRPGLGSAPGCVDIGWMDNGHVTCKLVPLAQAATLVTVVGLLSRDARPAIELRHLLRIAHVAGPWQPPERANGANGAAADAPSASRRSAEPVDGRFAVYEDLWVAG